MTREFHLRMPLGTVVPHGESLVRNVHGVVSGLRGPNANAFVDRMARYRGKAEGVCAAVRRCGGEASALANDDDEQVEAFFDRAA